MQAVSKFFKGLDKRHLQQQIDVHRLYLLTSFQHCLQEGKQLYSDTCDSLYLTYTVLQ